MAGVEDPAGAGRHRRVDGRAVQPDRHLADGVGRHDEHLGRALEGIGQARRIREVTATDPDAPFRQRPGLLRIPDADPDLFCGYAVDQPLHDGPAQLTVRSGDDDQVTPRRFHC